MLSNKVNSFDNISLVLFVGRTSPVSIFIEKNNSNQPILAIALETDEKNAKQIDYNNLQRVLKNPPTEIGWNKTETGQKIKFFKIINQPYTKSETQRIIEDLKIAFEEIKPSYMAIFDKKQKDDDMFYDSLNQILYGPPGTGKTYNTIIEAMTIIKEKSYNIDKSSITLNYPEVKVKFDKFKDEGQIQFVTFHQSYSYEEFVEGIKPITTQDGKVVYKVQGGVFKKICEKAI